MSAFVSPASGRVFSRTVVWMAALLLPFAARADGGVVRLRVAQGPFVVTVFSPADAASGSPVDVTVMVQRHDTGAVVMDAAVELNVAPPAGARLSPDDVFCGPAGSMALPGARAPGQPISFRATHAQAANKLLYGAPLVLPAAGDWQLGATVRQGEEVVRVGCALPVGLPLRKLEVIWPYLAFPLIAIALFAMNQWLVSSRQGK